MDRNNLPEALELLGTFVDAHVDADYICPEVAQMIEPGTDDTTLLLKLRASMDLIEQVLEEKQRVDEEFDASTRKDEPRQEND